MKQEQMTQFLKERAEEMNMMNLSASRFFNKANTGVQLP